MASEKWSKPPMAKTYVIFFVLKGNYLSLHKMGFITLGHRRPHPSTSRKVEVGTGGRGRGPGRPRVKVGTGGRGRGPGPATVEVGTGDRGRGPGPATVEVGTGGRGRGPSPHPHPPRLQHLTPPLHADGHMKRLGRLGGALPAVLRGLPRRFLPSKNWCGGDSCSRFPAFYVLGVFLLQCFGGLSPPFFP